MSAGAQGWGVTVALLRVIVSLGLWVGPQAWAYAAPPEGRGQGQDNERGHSGGGNGQLDAPDTGGFGDMGRHAGGGPSERPEQQSDSVGTHGGGGNSGGGNGQLESPDTGGFGNMGRGSGGRGPDAHPDGGSGDMGLHGAGPDRTSQADRETASHASAANEPERLHEHQARRDEQANRAEQRREELERRRAPEARGRDVAMAQVDRLTTNLRALERARWSYHPFDPRPQGNAGHVTMQDPFGFDRDSDRQGRDRGRPIRESAQPQQPNRESTSPSSSDINSLLIDFSVIPAGRDVWRSSETVWLAINTTDALTYTLDVSSMGLDGTTLQITTSFVSTYDYYTSAWVYDPATGTFQLSDGAVYMAGSYFSVYYEAGQTIWKETQEVTVTTDPTGNYTFTYSSDAPNSLLPYGGGDAYFDLVVTVTEPTSGATYTSTQPYHLYRCPYGIIYDKVTGQPIATATVTVHNADGSIVALDKAANPNVTNPQTTDATGRYNCKLAIGKKYYMTVAAPGYQAYRSGLFSELWTIVREDVAMTPAGPPLEAPASLTPVPTADQSPASAVMPSSAARSVPAGL